MLDHLTCGTSSASYPYIYSQEHHDSKAQLRWSQPCMITILMCYQVVHRHALLAEVEREWEVGTRLGFLAEPDGSLPGFMGTGAALRDSHGKFRGMILERLHGRDVEKIICTPAFADVRYIHDMLKCVFTALERAQAWLGKLCSFSASFHSSSVWRDT